MKYFITTVLLGCLAISIARAQLYNGGCVITIQEDAELYVADSYIHEAGIVNNAGIFSIRDQFSNISGLSPLADTIGTVLFFGQMPGINGSEINFNNVIVQSSGLAVSEQAMSIDGMLTLGDGIVDLGGNPLLIHNANGSAITAISGGILANGPTTVILGTGSGMDSYVLPFHNGNEQLNATLSLESMGDSGSNISISTFATAATNQPLPMTVSNLDILGQMDGANVVDRFWHIVPNGFMSNPAGNLTLSYAPSANRDNAINPEELDIFQWQEAGPWTAIASEVSTTMVSSQEQLELEGFFVLASEMMDTIDGSPIVMYDLDECDAYLESMTFQDYSEFVPSVNQLSCASVTATNVARENPMMNTHSCTPGLNGTEAMCVSSAPGCDFMANSPLAVRFRTTLNPMGGESIRLSGLSFFEQAPEMFDWIDGANGLNNYPTRFGLRVLRDGAEVFRSVEIATSRSWTEHQFVFEGVAFEATDITTFTFEFLGYCHVGNDSQVTAWDFEDIAVYASCGVATESAAINGMITESAGTAMHNVSISVMNNSNIEASAVSDQNGFFRLNQDDTIEDDAQVNFAFQSDAVERRISVQDAIVLYYHLLGFATITDPVQLVASDINGDNNVNVIDFIILREHILGRRVMQEEELRIYVRTSELISLGLLSDDQAIDYASLTTGTEDIVDITSILRGDIINSASFASSRSDLEFDLLDATEKLIEHENLHSVEEVDRAAIFPNPAAIGGNIYVHISSDITPDASIEIYNLLGERIMTIENPVRGNNRIEIDERVLVNTGFIIVNVRNQSYLQTQLVSVLK